MNSSYQASTGPVMHATAEREAAALPFGKVAENSGTLAHCVPSTIRGGALLRVRTSRPRFISFGRRAAMRRFLPLLSLFCLAVSACARSGSAPGTQAKPEGTGGAAGSAPTEAAEFADFVVGEPIRIRNLAVFPISAKTVHDADRFITLEEGLRAGTVEIFEVGAQPRGEPAGVGESSPQIASNRESRVSDFRDGAQAAEGADELLAFNGAADVNHLMVINRGDKPLYRMPGEVIVGGYKDRTIAEETILAANGKPVPVDVYCVEHGRWGGRSQSDAFAVLGAFHLSSSEADDAETVSRAAFESSQGKFVASAGTLSKKSRLAAQSGEGQQSVWDNVAATNASSGVRPNSGAFTANYVDDDVLKQIQPYRDALADPITEHERIIGVAVAINGKIEAVDVFESTPLFQKVWPRLLKGYALDAMHSADSPDAEKSCRVADAREFIEKVRQSQVDDTKESTNGLVLTRRNSKDVTGFSARTQPCDVDNDGDGPVAGFGGVVHAAGFSK